ncbi:tagaturonate epimerase family protein [Paenibacillus sp. J2TS4]|uniref:tagaturonate epimerase family protein n=1 Tax=Paenibacillus sp. J2TS4 TaxID=2807194 RepID=UPI001B06F105|nr:tagaturonate epimerase family protein [Paenibacillus sp. J2TS4]GIP31486.1 hypothetical protein J2TS4_06960 [Paenibacillus sp. J2TS4]
MDLYLALIEQWNEAEVDLGREGRISFPENGEHAGQIVVYGRSYTSLDGVKLLMVKGLEGKGLLVWGSGELYQQLNGEERSGYKLCGLTHENRLVLNRLLPYTAPRALGKQTATIGLGDRLGLASPGHIETVRGRGIRPVLAQQSIRELNLTNRDYKQVLDSACYAALQEGYRDGFGADGDHLKVEQDIEMALGLGFTMLTLDCSDRIDNTIEGKSEEEIAQQYANLPEDVRKRLEQTYLQQEIKAGSVAIHFDMANLQKYALVYLDAIGFTIEIYEKYIRNLGRPIDFELSIDETMTPTDPAAHYMVAHELYLAGLDLYSVAPRFCGEFQKGIDYIGDLRQFEQELQIHSAIADHFGYKLSIHSGSDKFSVFPMIAKYTKGRFHVKTAGTNWLEAMRTIAKVHPQLYRRMHEYALNHYPEALAYYHVTTDFDAIVPLAEMSDERLPEYMDENNARQLIHITYGLLLQAKDEQGHSLFKEELYRTLEEREAEYEQALIRHIGRHLELLGK